MTYTVEQIENELENIRAEVLAKREAVAVAEWALYAASVDVAKANRKHTNRVRFAILAASGLVVLFTAILFTLANAATASVPELVEISPEARVERRGQKPKVGDIITTQKGAIRFVVPNHARLSEDMNVTHKGKAYCLDTPSRYSSCTIGEPTPLGGVYLPPKQWMIDAYAFAFADGDYKRKDFVSLKRAKAFGGNVVITRKG